MIFVLLLHVSWLNYDNLFCDILCYVRYLRVHCCLLHADAWEGSYVLLNMGKFKVLSIYIYILSWSPIHKNVICMFVMRNRPLGKMFKLLKQMCIWRYLFCFYSILFFTRRKPNRLNNHVPYCTVQRWITLTLQRLLLVLKYCFDAG